MKGSLRKYKETGHFLFKVNDKLETVCNAPNDKAGVYLVYALKDNDKHLIYVGSSGHIDNAGKLSIRKTGGGGIKGRIVNGHISLVKLRDINLGPHKCKGTQLIVLKFTGLLLITMISRKAQAILNIAYFESILLPIMFYQSGTRNSNA